MPSSFVPEWAKSVVWYQIFPERFRNGDPSNDFQLDKVGAAYPDDDAQPWETHPWTSDWYAFADYEKAHPGKDIHWHHHRRRYGGDLRGILDKLDYLQDLGVSALYLNPIFDAPSHHKYDGSTYHHIDVNFGPDPAGDRALIASETPDDPSTWVWTTADKLFLSLVTELHKRGMRIIIDGVWNHMGTRSFAFLDVVKNQQTSRYKDWLKIDSWDDPEKGTKFDYTGWFGFKGLPEIMQDENGITGPAKKYIYDCTRRWMAPNGDVSVGIDGWRLDVAFCVAHPFWKDWRRHVRSINPEAYLVAETFGTISDLKPYLEGDEFDAVMNYNVAWIVQEYFINEKTRISTTEFDKLLRELREGFDTGVAYVMQNLLSSHDTARISSMIINKDTYPYRDWNNYHWLTHDRNPDYQVQKPTAADYEVQKLLAIFQMTYLGAPMIYYGDEIGMWGGNDPGCRKPMVWEDLNYEDEAVERDGTTPLQNPDPVRFDPGLFAHYRKLISIRNSFPALQLGDYKTLFIDDAKQVYVFSRTNEGETVIVALNNDTASQRVRVEGAWRDVLNDEKVENEFEVPPRWGRVLVK